MSAVSAKLNRGFNTDSTNAAIKKPIIALPTIEIAKLLIYAPPLRNKCSKHLPVQWYNTQPRMSSKCKKLHKNSTLLHGSAYCTAFGVSYASAHVTTMRYSAGGVNPTQGLSLKGPKRQRGGGIALPFYALVYSVCYLSLTYSLLMKP